MHYTVLFSKGLSLPFLCCNHFFLPNQHHMILSFRNYFFMVKKYIFPKNDEHSQNFVVCKWFHWSPHFLLCKWGVQKPRGFYVLGVGLMGGRSWHQAKDRSLVSFSMVAKPLADEGARSHKAVMPNSL